MTGELPCLLSIALDSGDLNSEPVTRSANTLTIEPSSHTSSKKKKRSHIVAKVGLELIIYSKLTVNLWKSRVSLLSTRATDGSTMPN